jgi:VWFA-related protein
MSQETDGAGRAPQTLKVDASFVWVPALVRSADDTAKRDLATGQFRLWDNGIPQNVVTIKTDDLPISLVILMQTGGSVNHYLSSYADLPTTLSQFFGSSVHEVTLVTFDSQIRQIWRFPARLDGVDSALTHQHPGDSGAAIKDAVHFGVRQLQAEPGRFRRIVLLLSQGVDQGSAIPSQVLAEQLGMASTVVYSLVFPGPKRSSKLGSHLAEPPLRESKPTALDKTLRAIDSDTASEFASLTGGTSIKFDDQGSFNSGLIQIAAYSRDAYTLGFQPTRTSPGLHTIRVAINSPRLKVVARSAYWYLPTTSITDTQH